MLQHTTSTPLIVAIIVVLLGSQTYGQQRLPLETNGIPDNQYERTGFSITDVPDATRHLRWREVAINDCCRILSERLEGKLTDAGQSLAGKAANLLGRLRATDQNAVNLLCQNLTLRPDRYYPPHPLNGYMAAEALIDIGGPRVACKVIEYLKEPRTETELLLCAQVLHKNDEREITFERMRLASEQARAEMTRDAHEGFERNLSLMRKYLNEPRFGKDAGYLPK